MKECVSCHSTYDDNVDFCPKCHIRLVKSKNIISCPKCKSTAVQIGKRGFSLLWGFFGSNQTVNRCGNCGYKWVPKN